MRIAAIVEKLLPLPHHAHVTVVEQDDFQWQIVLLASRQLLNTHLDTGFAGDNGHIGSGVGQLNSHTRWQAESHGAQPAGVDPAPGLVELVELGREHLMLTHVGGDERIALGHPVQRLYGKLRLDDAAVLIVLQAALATPFIDLFPPVVNSRTLGAFIALLEHLQHIPQNRTHRSHYRHVHTHIFGDG